MVHKGCISAGHYYAMLRPYGKSWLRFDDERIYPSSKWAAVNDNYGGSSFDMSCFYDVIRKDKSLKTIEDMETEVGWSMYSIPSGSTKNEFHCNVSR